MPHILPCVFWSKDAKVRYTLEEPLMVVNGWLELLGSIVIGFLPSFLPWDAFLSKSQYRWIVKEITTNFWRGFKLNFRSLFFLFFNSIFFLYSRWRALYTCFVNAKLIPRSCSTTSRSSVTSARHFVNDNFLFPSFCKNWIIIYNVKNIFFSFFFLQPAAWRQLNKGEVLYILLPRLCCAVIWI